MIDSNKETLITLAEAARHVPRRRAGQKCSTSTLYRWTARGCRGTVLESIQIGATRCTSIEALGRFFQRLTDQTRKPTTSTPTSAPIPPMQARDQVDLELDRLGLG